MVRKIVYTIFSRSFFFLFLREERERERGAQFFYAEKSFFLILMHGRKRRRRRRKKNKACNQKKSERHTKNISILLSLGSSSLCIISLVTSSKLLLNFSHSESTLFTHQTLSALLVFTR